MSIQLNNLDANCLYKPELRPAGVYREQITLLANGLISTLVVESTSGDVTVDYYDRVLGQEIFLESHTVLSTAGVDTICIPKFHNSLLAVVTTNGDSVFGIYTSSKAISGIDEIIVNGALPVTSDSGTPFHIMESVESVVDASVDVIDFTVPANTNRTLKTVFGSACEEGTFTLTDKTNSKIIAMFTASTGDANIAYKFDPPYPIEGGTQVVLAFESVNDVPVSTIFGSVMGTDIT